MSKTIAVIDGDIVAFRAAAANETRSITATHKVTGQETHFPHRTAFKAQIAGAFEESEFDIVDVQTEDEISFAYHAMKTTIEALRKSCKADEVEVYLSGENNFRDSLPLPSKYKGKREGAIRPLQLKDSRAYLLRRYAEIVHGREVDDKLTQRQYEGLKSGDKVIACTIDGDANGCEGWLYNWTKMTEPKLIKGLGEVYPHATIKSDFDGYGRKFFYAQWVVGDAVDCFKPCEIAGKKWGATSMLKLLTPCKTDKECVQAVYDQYRKWYPAPVTYTDWTGTEQTKTCIEIMDMYAACAHMKRFEDDVFDTAKLLDKLGIEQ